MFELKIAWKYLIPQKRALSTSLISLLSVFVISLVVWLVVVFLSVTTGIENNWLTKLTSLNAPVRITPTPEYFASYYYRIDQFSSASNYGHKTIGEKAIATSTDPYQPEVDSELPLNWPMKQVYEDGNQVDLVKDLYAVLDGIAKKRPGLRFQDYEISGALMRLDLIRPMFDRENGLVFEENSSSISQMSFLLTLAENNPQLPRIMKSPTVEDINHLLQTAKPSDLKWIEYVKVKKAALKNQNYFPVSFLDPSKEYNAYLLNGAVILSSKKSSKSPGISGNLLYDKSWKFQSQTGSHDYYKVLLKDRLEFDVLDSSNKELKVRYALQGISHHRNIPWDNIELTEATAITSFENTPVVDLPWAYTVSSEHQIQLPSKEFSSGVLLPCSYQKNGVLLGDKGYLAFQAPAAGSTQEQRMPIHVTGFYDPGMLPIGNKSIIVPSHITRTLNGVSQIFSPDGTPNNGVFIWHENLADAPEIQKQIQTALDRAGLSSFWNVQTFKDYEFSKDLMQQFQSDRLLFTLIAGIILIVACSNIISMLVLLVNDKKKEIATLRAMGAESKHIALIFGTCGATIGIVSSLLGIFAAVFTLQHLDVLVSFLSAIQGHDAFNAAFFGDVLPNQLSWNALWFVAIVTPIVSIVAGLIPALKATRMKTSIILRSE